MKAITVRQPWAWAIIHGCKDIENRSQAWTYRGPLAIHAGKEWSLSGQHSGLVWSALKEYGWPVGPYAAQRRGLFTFGAIIGVVDLIDVHHAEPDAVCCDSPWAESRYRDQVTGKEIGSVVHLVHENPRPIAQPIVCPGRLGLWTPDDDLTTAIQEALAA